MYLILLNFIGKEKKKKELIEKLDEFFKRIREEYCLIGGDFPNVDEMREKLKAADWSKFKVIDMKTISKIDVLLSEDMSRIFQKVRSKTG